MSLHPGVIANPGTIATDEFPVGSRKSDAAGKALLVRPRATAGWADGTLRRAKRWMEWLVSRPQRRSRLLSVVERLDLGPKKSVWILAYGERHFLVAGGAETMGAALEVYQGNGGSQERIPVMTPARWMAD